MRQRVLGKTGIAVGELGLSPRARLDGLLRVTVAGLEQFVAAQGGLERLALRSS